MLSRLMIKLAEETTRSKIEYPEPPGPVDRALWHPRPSSAGLSGCTRAAVYEGLGIKPEPFPGRTFLVFDDGHWHEELTADWLRGSAYQLHSIQMALNIAWMPWIKPGLWRRCPICRKWVPADEFHGHADWVMTDPLSRDDLVEHKSASTFSWARHADGELPLDNIAQTGSYLVGANKINPDLTRAVLLIKNKNTAQYLDFVLELDGDDLQVLEFEVSMDQVAIDLTKDQTDRWKFPNGTRTWPNFLSDIFDRFKRIQGYIDQCKLPKRMYAMGVDWQCDYCRWSKVCWEEHKGERKKSSAVHVPGLAKLLEERSRLVKFAKDEAKLFKDAKRMAITAAADEVHDGGWGMRRIETKKGDHWRTFRRKEQA